jgi:tetratricopeptide (TPR) repeat protein
LGKIEARHAVLAQRALLEGAILPAGCYRANMDRKISSLHNHSEWQFWPLILLLLEPTGCGKSRTLLEKRRSVSTATAASVANRTQSTGSASIVASSSASAREGSSLPTDLAVVMRKAEAAVARGRRLAQQERWLEAIGEFDQAVRVRPLAPEIRSERGYLHFKAGRYHAASKDLVMAASVPSSPSLKAQIHYNLGLTLDALNDTELGRINYAIAEAQGSRAAGPRLGSASRCTAHWTTKPQVTQVPIAKGYRELYRLRGDRTDQLDRLARTEAGAERVMCAGLGQGQEDTGQVAKCESHNRYQLIIGCSGNLAFHFGALFSDYFHYALVSGEDFNPDYTLVGQRLMDRLPPTPPSEITGNFLDHDPSVVADYSPAASPKTCWSDELDRLAKDPGSQGICHVVLPGNVELTQNPRCTGGEPSIGPPLLHTFAPKVSIWYDVRSRQALLRIESWSGEVDVAWRGSRAIITGAGCDASIEVTGGTP